MKTTTTKSKLVHANVYDPSGPRLFKSDKNDKCQAQTVHCSMSDNCELLKRGECMMTGGFGKRCPYGKYNRHFGYTRRARKFHSWISERKEMYKDVPYLNAMKDKLARIGDYILLPYTFMDHKDIGLPVQENSQVFISGVPLLPIEHWNVETIVKILKGRPMALFGGEIPDYQRKSVPLFITHLREEYPKLFTEFCQAHGELAEAKGMLKPIDYVGRKALLNSIKSGVAKVGKETWKWNKRTRKLSCIDPDGIYWLKMDTSKGGRQKELDVSITLPKDHNVVTEIISNDQVNSTTEFID